MNEAEIKDLTIIGGGPTGLFAAFYAGMRGASARIIESLPELGGQLTALYPEKSIYDVGGFPKITARELAANLIEQGLQFGPDVHLGEQVQDLIREDGRFIVTTDKGRYPSRAVIIAGGKGAFTPRVLECPGYDKLLGRGVLHHVKDPAAFAGKRVLIVGGGDSAVDWALSLKDVCQRLILIHRRDGFRAHAHSMKLLRAAVEAGEVELLTHKEVRAIHGDECVRAVTIFDNRTGEELTFDVDAVLALIGFKPDLGPIARWGIELEGNCIKVGPTMETSIPGVYAAGDIVAHQAKLELIVTGFSEAAIAVNNAIHYINPKARVNPGHSTNLKIFKEREAAESSETETV
ncbi:MAG TPA: NAD(P)/FAD-dependent oxidoreductase [Longimicrobiales bacterium]